MRPKAAIFLEVSISYVSKCINRQKKLIKGIYLVTKFSESNVNKTSKLNMRKAALVKDVNFIEKPVKVFFTIIGCDWERDACIIFNLVSFECLRFKADIRISCLET